MKGKTQKCSGSQKTKEVRGSVVEKEKRKMMSFELGPKQNMGDLIHNNCIMNIAVEIAYYK